MENLIYIGHIEKRTSKAGKEYFKGWIGNVPVIAFWGQKDPDKIYIKYVLEIDDEKEGENQVQGDEANQADDLPF